MNFLSLLKRSLVYKLKKKTNVDLDGIEYSSLDKLFTHYGTDKSEYSKDKKNKTHGFSKYYTKHINKFRTKRIKFLEIGCGEGISAAAFTKYLKKSNAYCLDVNLTNVRIKSKRINYFGLNLSLIHI